MIGANATFDALLESILDGIVIANGRGEIEAVNTQLEQMFGYTRPELLGRPVELLIPARFR